MHRAHLRSLLRTVTDLPGHWRALNSQPRLDVVSLRPLRDAAERQRRFADPDDKRLQASGARRRLAGIHAQARVLNLTPLELQTRGGRLMGRECVLEALVWAVAQGARVVRLDPALRELFGTELAELRARFPSLLLCGGENGRAWLLGQQLTQLLTQAFPWQARVLVLAPYEEPGQTLSRQLQAAGHPVLGWGPDAARLRAWAQDTGLTGLARIADIGAVDLVLSASSDPAARLDFAQLQQLRRRCRRLLVVDAAESVSLSADLLAVCQDTVRRLDGGWARGPRPAKPLPGSMAEALALFHAVYRLRSSVVLRRDWFQVGSFHQLLVGEAMRELGLAPADAASFGTPLQATSLQLDSPVDPLLPAPPEPLRPPRSEAMPLSA